jgi:hypothetical protein
MTDGFPGVIPVPAFAGMNSAGIRCLLPAETLGPRLRGDDDFGAVEFAFHS